MHAPEPPSRSTDGVWVFRSGLQCYCIVIRAGWVYWGTACGGDAVVLPEICAVREVGPAAGAPRGGGLHLVVLEPSGERRSWTLGRDSAVPWRHSWSHVRPDIVQVRRLRTRASSRKDCGSAPSESPPPHSASDDGSGVAPEEGRDASRGTPAAVCLYRATGGSVDWPPTGPSGTLGAWEMWCGAALGPAAAAGPSARCAGTWRPAVQDCPVAELRFGDDDWVHVVASGATGVNALPHDEDVPFTHVTVESLGQAITVSFPVAGLQFRLRLCGGGGSIQWGRQSPPRSRMLLRSVSVEVVDPPEYERIAALYRVPTDDVEAPDAAAESPAAVHDSAPRSVPPRHQQLRHLGGQLRTSGLRDAAARKSKPAPPPEPRMPASARRVAAAHRLRESQYNCEVDVSPGIPDLFSHTNEQIRAITGGSSLSRRVANGGGRRATRALKALLKRPAAPRPQLRPGPRSHISEPPPGSCIDAVLLPAPNVRAVTL
eukprot:TRINITY_DN16797_c0_g1_i1.p1 TRINITY_DN16797_c0_g1~~TRINITY_DN16797_c0_g1_i1.p1  ORF type:complete len:487 (+),score=131.79 TRINITY_DN16797_c0_g1_i1:59-1519(+)